MNHSEQDNAKASNNWTKIYMGIVVVLLSYILLMFLFSKAF